MTTLSGVAGTRACPCCGGILQVKVAAGGKHPGHPYVHCPPPCNYHFTLPKTTVPDAPVVSPSLFQSVEGICDRLGCRRPSHRLCEKRMCKQCCIAAKGCSAPGHNFARLSDRQKGKLQARQSVPSPSFDRPIPQPLTSTATPYTFERSLSPPSNFFTNLGNSATVNFPETQTQHYQEESTSASQLAAEHKENSDYQAAIAASLGLQYTTLSPGPTASSSFTPPTRITSTAPQRVQLAIPRQMPPVKTVSYKPPGITNHMTALWMRETTDNTKQPVRVPRANPGNKFVIVFWGKSGEGPIVIGVNDCPQWPTWVLMGSASIQDTLDVGNERLEYYDVRCALWVLCLPSYPHEVKKDCRLLLRRPGIICADFETHHRHAAEKPIHLWLNTTGERAAIKEELSRRKKNPPAVVVEDSDDEEVEFVSPRPKKRRLSHLYNDPDNTQPSQRARVETPTSSKSSVHSSRHSSPPASPMTPLRFPSSPSSPRRFPLSPLSLQHDSVYVPASSKVWPGGMYTVDMEQVFLKVESKALKKLYSNLPARLAFVFGKAIRPNTYYDQQRIWRKGTDAQHRHYVGMGRSEDGLWSKFRAAVKS